METKRNLYNEDEILTLEFDDGVALECGIMGTFEVNGREYIALDDLNDSSADIYLYEYVATDEDFELVDIPEGADFDAIAAEFERITSSD